MTVASATNPLTLSILSVNVGHAREIGVQAGKAVISAIRKAPTERASLQLNWTNLEGDSQADLVNHGGADKAIYGYCSEYWPLWEAEHGLRCGPGLFGENLTLSGATEDDVRIGDVFAWDGVRLQISQPRQPCYKLSLHLSREDIAPAMVMTARCGWYMRVLATGRVSVKGATLTREESSVEAPSVRHVFRSYFDRRVAHDEIERLASCTALASPWRDAFAKRLRNRPLQ